MRSIIVGLLSLSLVQSLWANAGDPVQSDTLQVTSTSVELARSTATTVPVELKIKNLAGQTVTAYTYSITASYPNGEQVTTRESIDDLSPLVAERLGLPVAPGTALIPGGTVNIVKILPIKNGAVPASISVSFLMIALADKTARGDQGEINDLQESRRSQINLLKETVANLRTIVSSPSPKQLADELVSRLTIAAKKPDTTQSNTKDQTPNGNLDLLRMLSSAYDTDHNAFQKTLAVYEVHLDITTDHASIARRR